MDYSNHSHAYRADSLRSPIPSPAPPHHEEVTDENIRRYTRMESRKVLKHIQDLEREWDMERALQLHTSAMTLTGTALGLTVNKKWFVLPVLAGLFLLQHRVQGWCPPLPLLRHFGFRPRSEIEMEKHTLRGHLIPID